MQFEVRTNSELAPTDVADVRRVPLGRLAAAAGSADTACRVLAGRAEAKQATVAGFQSSI